MDSPSSNSSYFRGKVKDSTQFPLLLPLLLQVHVKKDVAVHAKMNGCVIDTVTPHPPHHTSPQLPIHVVFDSDFPLLKRQNPPTTTTHTSIPTQRSSTLSTQSPLQPDPASPPTDVPTLKHPLEGTICCCCCYWGGSKYWLYRVFWWWCGGINW